MTQVGEQQTPLPDVTVSVGLHPVLNGLLEADEVRRNAIRSALEAVLEDILRRLGVPGLARVTPGPLAEAKPGQRYLTLSVNDHRCYFPDSILAQSYGYLTGVRADIGASPADILDWLSTSPTDGASSASEDRLCAFLTLVTREIVRLQPGVLLDLPHAVTYGASLPLKDADSSSPLRDGTQLLSILRAVLDMRGSLANRDSVAQLLEEAVASDTSSSESIESLVAALTAKEIEIQLPMDYLKELTETNPEQSVQLFPFLRKELFGQLGVAYPEFRFVPVDDLKPETFRFSLGHLPTLPFLGLRTHECLVNAPPEAVSWITPHAEAALNPATGQWNSIIDLALASPAVQQGMGTWTNLQHLVLTLDAMLRLNNGYFVDGSMISTQLEIIRYVYSALFEAVTARMGISHITRLLRALASELISIRNLRLILECLVDYEEFHAGTLVPGHSGDGMLTGSLPPREEWERVAFVRMGMRRILKHMYVLDDTITGYQVDQVTAQALADAAEDGDGNGSGAAAQGGDERLAALRDALYELTTREPAPVLITTALIRPALRAWSRLEFPRLSILARDELPPDTQLAIVATLPDSIQGD